MMNSLFLINYLQTKHSFVVTYLLFIKKSINTFKKCELFNYFVYIYLLASIVKILIEDTVR